MGSIPPIVSEKLSLKSLLGIAELRKKFTTDENASYLGIVK